MTALEFFLRLPRDMKVATFFVVLFPCAVVVKDMVGRGDGFLGVLLFVVGWIVFWVLAFWVVLVLMGANVRRRR